MINLAERRRSSHQSITKQGTKGPASTLSLSLGLSHNNFSDAGLKLLGAALVGFEGFDGLRAETFLANVTSSCGRSRVWRRLERSIDLSWAPGRWLGRRGR